MRYDSDVLIIDEVFDLDPEEFQSVIRSIKYSMRVGDTFFIMTPYTHETYYVEAIEEYDDHWIIIYNGGRRVPEKNVFPLFSVGSLISMLSYDHDFDLRTAGRKWIVIFDHCHEYASDEDELLVSFLWYVLKDLCVRGFISREE
ncbi:ABC transporter ATP-binding protein [Paenibacillus sp. DCT19]|uniref:ABC transporter ATP-binding protein n=1 Tax=Paenibacillus sp. DCT19 TaxID=2211212 RepID=UPI000FE2576F|nr:ABC transporter ATP-binding protein [Paenibacillus sp. DCT19]